MNTRMIVTGVDSRNAPKTFQEAVELANRTSGPLLVPRESLKLMVAGELVEGDDER